MQAPGGCCSDSKCFPDFAVLEDTRVSAPHLLSDYYLHALTMHWCGVAGAFAASWPVFVLLPWTCCVDTHVLNNTLVYDTHAVQLVLVVMAHFEDEWRITQHCG